MKEVAKEKGNKNIILLSDGDVNVKDTRITSAAQNSIRIHTIGLGKGADNEALKKCSRLTGGEHFTATTAKKLEEIYSDLSDTNKYDFSYLDDKDGDGVPDDIEIYGIPMPNGELVFTDPNEKHSDKDIAHPTGDGLTDGEEVGKLVRQSASWYTPEEYVKAMCYKSIGVYEDSFTWISGNRFLTLTDKSPDSVKPLNSIYEYEYLQQWMLSLDHIENFYTWRRYLHPEEFQ